MEIGVASTGCNDTVVCGCSGLGVGSTNMQKFLIIGAGAGSSSTLSTILGGGFLEEIKYL